jgi:hypothetical protein
MTFFWPIAGTSKLASANVARTSACRLPRAGLQFFFIERSENENCVHYRCIRGNAQAANRVHSIIVDTDLPPTIVGCQETVRRRA